MAAVRVAAGVRGWSRRVRVGRVGRRKAPEASPVPPEDDHELPRGGRRWTPAVVRELRQCAARKRRAGDGAEAPDWIAGRARQGARARRVRSYAQREISRAGVVRGAVPGRQRPRGGHREQAAEHQAADQAACLA